MTEGLLYDDDWQEIASRKPDNFRLTYAISREQTTKAGDKMYVQDRLAESAEELFERMDNGAHIYFCGLKGMMPGILETLEGVAKARGVAWEEKLDEWKKAGQWHVVSMPASSVTASLTLNLPWILSPRRTTAHLPADKRHVRIAPTTREVY